jgi:hypothetical protein
VSARMGLSPGCCLSPPPSGMLVNNNKTRAAKLEEGKTPEEYVTSIMGDFGPGCDVGELTDAELAQYIGAANPVKEQVLAALRWADENLGPKGKGKVVAPRPRPGRARAHPGRPRGTRCAVWRTRAAASSPLASPRLAPAVPLHACRREAPAADVRGHASGHLLA